MKDRSEDIKKYRLEHINKLQVPTWSWLAINDTNAELDITGLKPYEKAALRNVNGNIKALTETGKASETTGRTSEITEKSWEVTSGIKEYVQNQRNQIYHISIGDGEAAKEPVVLDFTMDQDNSLLIEDIVIDAGEDSKATVIIKYSGQREGGSVHCGHTRLDLKRGAEVTLIKVQLLADCHTHVDGTQVTVGEGASCDIILAELGGEKTVSACNVSLMGEGSRAEVNSIYIGNRSKTMDMNYRIEYGGKDTVGNITARGALLGGSRKVFKNTLDFLAGSSGSKGREEESVIALSEKAVNISAPLLLCAEDQVEGQHASNIGRLADSKLFYLLSRGLSEEEAKKLMVEASFAPIVGKIPEEALRGQISRYVTEVIQHGE